MNFGRLGVCATVLFISTTGLYGGNANAGSVAYDGPAALPQANVNIVMPKQTGKTTQVLSGGDLQGAINAASCGDTIELQAGATFQGQFVLPAKACDDAHWIVIKTSSSYSVLPTVNQRINPCYAGVASLPGRPAFSCPASSKKTMAKIVMPSLEEGVIQLADKATHYRLIGLEITRAPGFPLDAALIMKQNTGNFDHLILDRCWIHGTPNDDTSKGIELGSSNNVAIINSYMSDFHCDEQHLCVEAQTIGGGTGNLPMGTYLIQNNFLEASTQAILFGGEYSTTSPTDITVRHNHMYKPMTWLKGQPGFVGGPTGHPFVVKNIFELKNAQRVLVEGNILENVWAGFTQPGYAVLITPKNEGGYTYNLSTLSRSKNVVSVTTKTTMAWPPIAGEQVTINGASDTSFNGLYNVVGTSDSTTFHFAQVAADGTATGGTSMSDVCPLCEVTDLTFRYNKISHMGSGFSIANAQDGNGNSCARDGERYSFHDLTLDDIGNPLFDGFGDFLELQTGAPCAPMKHIHFDHITAFAPGLSATVGAFGSNLMTDINITNSILNDGLMNSDGGGATNCAHGTTSPDKIIEACFTTFDVTNNALIGKQESWPSGQFYPATSAAVHFVNYKNANGGNYTLLPSSPYKNAGTDGKDVGADITLLNSETAGAE